MFKLISFVSAMAFFVVMSVGCNSMASHDDSMKMDNMQHDSMKKDDMKKDGMMKDSM